MADDLSEKIYYKSPTWLQHVFVSIKGWEYRYRRADDRIMRNHYQFLMKSQYLIFEEFQKYQLQQLHNILRIAFAHVPYYREIQKKLGCTLNDFRSPEDIRLLPILEKSQIRGNEYLFLNEAFDMKKAGKGFTSGTTGTPLHLFECREGFSRRWAFVARLRQWAGVNDPFYPRTYSLYRQKNCASGKFPQGQCFLAME